MRSADGPGPVPPGTGWTDDLATWATRGHLLMVADGMGAHAAGELASKLAVDNIPHTYFKLRDLYPVEFQHRITLMDDAQYSGQNPWPLTLDRAGRDHFGVARSNGDRPHFFETCTREPFPR